MNEARNLSDSDFDKLSRRQAFVCGVGIASESARVGRLQAAFGSRIGIRRQIFLEDIARITCQNASGEGVSVALLAPGFIPEQFPSLPFGPGMARRGLNLRKRTIPDVKAYRLPARELPS